MGLGATQVNAGLSFVAGIPISVGSQLVIIALITAAATASVVSGFGPWRQAALAAQHVHRRRRCYCSCCSWARLSFLLDAWVQNLGAYLQRLPENSFWTATFDQRPPQPQQTWLAGNTIFYWAWWIAWAPFVGMFIARISKGRTIREFVTGVLLGPTAAGMVWLTVFGDSALYEELYGAGGIAAAVTEDTSTAIFVLLSRFPLASVSMVACVICITLFLRDLVGLGVAGDRHDRIGRLHRPSGLATSLLGGRRGRGCWRPAAWRRPGRAADRRDHYRPCPFA